MLEQSGDVMVVGNATRGTLITAAGTRLVKTGGGKIDGIIVNSHTSGAISIVDGLTYSAGGLIHGTISFAAGERYIPFFGERFETGLFVTSSGTLNATLLYR